MKCIGYWYAWNRTHRDFPDPRHLVHPGWLEQELRLLLNYLKSGGTYIQWRGYASCTFKCGIADCEMGSRDLTDGVWVWPEGLHHYVEQHHVILPDEFIDHCRRNQWAMPSGLEPERLPEEVDTAFWVDWAASRLGGYVVDVLCPSCGEHHRLARNLQLSPGPAKAGSVAELYANGELPAVLVVLLGDKAWCEAVGHWVQQPDPVRMFLAPRRSEAVA